MSNNQEWIENENYGVIDLPVEMKNSFLDYSMSVIVSRALPDVRDGLKPVQRRILYGMNELGVTPDKPYKKSARIVGDVMGKYHPHGDSAIYEAMVRMAQPFSYRQMLIDGHGNFGSVDGHGAAAMRYTEARMSKIALEMVRDLNKDTVDFIPNYDGEEQEPEVLPSRFPNLLVNGATGIAVGMATNIPPHNLGEVIEALFVLIKNPDVSVDELMEVMPGPDFPTGGVIMGRSGIKRAYKTGKGRIIVRSKVEIEELRGGAERIVITEIPYGVNKARLVQRIAELAREKEIEGITYANDESDREGMRIVVEVHRDASVGVVLNNLFKYTAMQTTFGVNMLAIDQGVPKILSLKEILNRYLIHQESVIIRRTQFDKNKAEARAHVLEGLQVALDHIDEIITIIRGSADSNIAKDALMTRFDLTDIQAQAILDMRLVRLTGLEREKIDQEYNDLQELIRRLTEILGSRERVYQLIEDELTEIKTRFDDERRTEINSSEIIDIDDEDLIDEEDILIALSSNGYIKRMTDGEFQTQNRGGRGVKGMGVGDNDVIQTLVSCNTHDTLLFFTNTGRVFSSRGYEVPEYGRQAKGIPVVNLLNLAEDESIKGIIAVNEDIQQDQDLDQLFLFFITRDGVVKRTRAKDYFNIRSNGLIAISLRDDDELVSVFQTDGKQNIIIGTQRGYAIIFNEDDVRVVGRSSYGVKGANLRQGDYVVGGAPLEEGAHVLTVTDQGYGKKTPASEYPVKSRGTKGIITARLTEKSGQLVNLSVVKDEEDDLILMTDGGIVIRINLATVSKTGRNATGVRLIRLGSEDKVNSIAFISNNQGEEDYEE